MNYATFVWNRNQDIKPNQKGKTMANEKPTRDPTHFTNIEDTALVAFLKLKGHAIKPWISKDDPIANEIRVSFDIEESDVGLIEKDMQSFYDNEQIGIQDFCRCLKEVKSAMYNLRRLKNKAGARTRNC